ncbi:hypothetical protein AC1031_010202 [Aphanomyces cochlioides]|nr:hypothetical protein AC1031_010202 [Aphanomyces cochlioides]
MNRSATSQRKQLSYERTPYSNQFKWDVLSIYEQEGLGKNGLTCAINKHFKEIRDDCIVSKKKLIQRWFSKKAELAKRLQTASNRQVKRQRKLGTGKTLSDEQEEEIYRFVLDARKEGVPVSNFLLEQAAIEVAQAAGYTASEIHAGAKCRYGFLRRKGLSVRAKTRSGQSTNEQGEEVLVSWAQRVKARILENNVELVLNADQTAVNFDAIGSAKDRATAMLMADTEGKKYPLFMIFKSKKSTVKATVERNRQMQHGLGNVVWKEIQGIQEKTDVQLYENPSAWWNTHITIEFLTYHFGHRAQGTHRPIMIIWDDFSPHFTDEVVSYAANLNILLEKVPPTYT